MAARHKHKFSEEWKSDETSHWHEATCDHKDEVDAKAPHIYDNDSDVDCNVCGYVRNLTPAATQFTVTFVMNDHGAQIEAVKVDENGKLSKPADPHSRRLDGSGAGSPTRSARKPTISKRR